MSWLDSITNSTDMSLNKLWETVKDRGAWSVSVPGATRSQIQLSESTATGGPLASHVIHCLTQTYVMDQVCYLIHASLEIQTQR